MRPVSEPVEVDAGLASALGLVRRKGSNAILITLIPSSP